jgi:large subunit ribosomal protein L23
MTVQLAKPFVWPEEPEDFEDWNKDVVEESDKEMEKQQKLLGSDKDTVINEDRRERMKEQAKALLSGKTKWRPGQKGL